LGSICGGTAELEGREAIVTLRRTSCSFPKGISEKAKFWLKEGRKRVRRYDTTRL